MARRETPPDDARRDEVPDAALPAPAARRMTTRDILLNPINLAPMPVLVLYIVGQRHGFVADVPLWMLLGSLVLAHFASTSFALLFPPGDSSYRRAVLHMAVEFACIALTIYLVGWGALLAVGFVFSAAGHMGVDGARVGRPAIALTLGAIAAGQLAVAAGVVETLLPRGQVHGLAALSALGVCLVIWVLEKSRAETEQVEASLRNSEERFRALVQHASDVIMVVGPGGDVRYVSPALERLLGYCLDEVDRFGPEVVHPDDLDSVAQKFRSVVEDPSLVAWFELRVAHADGGYRWFEVGVTNRLDDPSVDGLVCNMRDTTERRRFQDQLAYQVYHDELTNLPNRVSFLEELAAALRKSRERESGVAVLFLDVDRFKLVNDSLGHAVGDRLLVAVAERLRECLRPEDLVARFGGDEFTIVLSAVDGPEDAVRVAERITGTLRDPIVVGGRELVVSASIGIALARDASELPGDLLRQADLAMYLAKEKGRSRWELFDAHHAPQIVERLELEGDLWRAVETDELMVHFQPELALASDAIVGAEALVRWNHPRRGVLLPEVFVPVAEESSLIVAIDRQVLQTACRWARQWADDPSVPGRPVVSVNVSPRFIRQIDAVADVTEALRASGADPRCLQIEITERSALSDVDGTVARLYQLRSLGVRVAIDDFGTGYSSLGYLRRLPIDVVKLDRSFVEAMDSVDSDVAIVQAVITMGHALGMKVTAEGVERDGQARHLRALGCDTAMGWLWSPAVPPEELTAALHDRARLVS